MTSRRRFRIGGGLLVAVASVTAIGLSPTSAGADPPPNTDPVQQYKALGVQAAQADEDLLFAQHDLATKQVQLQQAVTQLAQAQQAQRQALTVEHQFQGQIDQLAAASFEGARMGQVSALLTGTSTRDYLDRATFLRELSDNSAVVMGKYQAAVNQAASARAQAEDAQHRAQDAETAAAQLVTTITQRKQALDIQIAQVKAALAKLTPPQRATLNNVGDTRTVFVAPSAPAKPAPSAPAKPAPAKPAPAPSKPSAPTTSSKPVAPAPPAAPTGLNAVIQAALSRRGDEYVWGAAGPNQFDCSGLTMWSYAHAGVSLPHSSRAQYQLGTPVAYGQWQAGDLLFFGSSAATIHHVAMYLGNGEIIQAPTEGVPVQVVPVAQGGRDYFGAKRIMN